MMTDNRRPTGKGSLPPSPPPSSSRHLCVDCVHFALLRAPGDDPPEPTCCNEESRHCRLPKGCPACDLFEHKMLSAIQVAKLFGVNEQMVRRMAEEWRDSGGVTGLAGITIGKLWRFRREDVVAYLERR